MTIKEQTKLLGFIPLPSKRLHPGISVILHEENKGACDKYKFHCTKSTLTVETEDSITLSKEEAIDSPRKYTRNTLTGEEINSSPVVRKKKVLEIPLAETVYRWEPSAQKTT